MDAGANQAQADFGFIETDDSSLEHINLPKTDDANSKIPANTEPKYENPKEDLLDIKLAKDIGTDYTYKRKIVWFNAIGFLLLHIAAVYGFLLCFTTAKLGTSIFMFVFAYAGGEGITMGAHRLYSHKSFKASPSLKFVLLFLQTISGQNCLYIWARDHRQHHRYSDTDADPHNAMRGFFFSHIGWLMSKKHPAVLQYGKGIDMSDLEADWMVMFQKKYYNQLYLIFAVVIPIVIPVWLWGEGVMVSFYVSYALRYILQLNVTWLVNSAAHLYGTRPYDKNIVPVETWIVSFLSSGEGWHNYHHAFPWDYKASEYGMHFSATSQFIRFFAWLGLAYDLREAGDDMVKSRVTKKGDGTHFLYGDAKDEVTTSFNTYLHPMNPTYRSKSGPAEIRLGNKGLPLMPEDLPPKEQKRIVGVASKKKT